MKVPLTVLRPGAILPTYQTEGSAAMDLSAAIEEALVLQPHQRTVIPTGVAVALPLGYEAQIRARSGLSLKHGISLANGVGTIDSDYRGEIGVILVNLSDEAFTVTPNMRIAQMVVAKYEQIRWENVESLPESDRHTGGFGSTGS